MLDCSRIFKPAFFRHVQPAAHKKIQKRSNPQKDKGLPRFCEGWRRRLFGFESHPFRQLAFFNQEGVATVLKPGRACEILAANTLASGFMTSPAVAGKAFFLRTKTHLYRIESTLNGEL